MRQRREKLGLSHQQVARKIGRHASYIEALEDGRIPLVWEDGVRRIWDYFAEVTLEQRLYECKTVPLKKALYAPVQERSHEDRREQISLLRIANATLVDEIRQLKETSSLWKEFAAKRAEVIRDLRIELGADPDMDDEEL